MTSDHDHVCNLRRSHFVAVLSTVSSLVTLSHVYDGFCVYSDVVSLAPNRF